MYFSNLSIFEIKMGSRSRIFSQNLIHLLSLNVFVLASLRSVLLRNIDTVCLSTQLIWNNSKFESVILHHFPYTSDSYATKMQTSTFNERWAVFAVTGTRHSVKAARTGSRHVRAAHCLPFILVTALVRHFNGPQKGQKYAFTWSSRLWCISGLSKLKGHTQMHSLWIHTPAQTDWRSGNTRRLTEQPLTKTGRRLDDAKRWNQ